MSRSRTSRVGNVGAMVRLIHSLPADGSDPANHKRKMVAELCRLIEEQVRPRPDPTAGLTPRHLQTLQRLLAGDSEKEVAVRLGVSRHTVHVYVSGLYRHFDVSSRGELLARFVRQPVHSQAYPLNR